MGDPRHVSRARRVTHCRHGMIPTLRTIHSGIRRLIETADGGFLATFSPLGLQSLDFPANAPRIAAAVDSQGALEHSEWLVLTKAALTRALEGLAPESLPPLDLCAGTPFQQRVWRVLAGIPTGETRTYGQVAQTVGSPGASRAIGRACGANPIPVLIPCHRVVAAQGKLGGFSGGLDWKRLLLEREARHCRLS